MRYREIPIAVRLADEAFMRLHLKLEAKELL